MNGAACFPVARAHLLLNTSIARERKGPDYPGMVDCQLKPGAQQGLRRYAK
ncbi:MAG TPA: hypothetical protein VFL76_03245 [Edaphocola sp.]|nr:hypothetical protein [Edaphocola sp.]